MTETNFLTKTKDAVIWKRVGACIQVLVEEASFTVDSEGLKFRAMDPSHVALIDVVWPASDFEKFECQKSDSFTVRVEDFVKLLRRATDKDSIEMSRAGSDSLMIGLRSGYKRDFELHLVETSKSTTPIPKLTFDCSVTFAKSTFKKAMDDVSAVANHITIEATKDQVTFSGKGDSGNSRTILSKENLLGISCEKESKSTYNLEYLAKIDSAVGDKIDSLEFSYGTKLPCKIVYKIGEKGVMQYYLAPRVSE